MGSETALLLPISGTDRPLVSGRLGDASAVAHCVHAAASCRLPVRPIVIATARDLVVDVEAGLAAQGLLASVSLVPVSGPASRADCLRAAVHALESAAPAVTNVLIHDVRRPLASAELCARVAEALTEGHEVVIPALAMVDSVKSVDHTGSIRATVDRSALRSAQFPRGFALPVLRDALATPAAELDEIAYVIAEDLPVKLVTGDPDAFLIDRSRDVALVEAILACRLAGRR